MDAGTIGGISGSVIGLCGGAIGVHCSLKNSKSAEEKALVIKFSIIMTLLSLLFIGAIFLVPSLYTLFLLTPYSLLMTLGILKFNKKTAELRSNTKIEKEES